MKTKSIITGFIALISFTCLCFGQAITPLSAIPVKPPTAFATAKALPSDTEAEKLTRGQALTAAAVTPTEKGFAYKALVQGMAGVSGYAAAIALPPPSGISLNFYGSYKFDAAKEVGDWATAETQARAIVALKIYDKFFWQAMILWTLREQEKDATLDASNFINSVSFGDNWKSAKLNWDSINRSTITKDAIIALANKILLTVNVTPESAPFLGMLKSTRDLLSE